MAKTYSHNFLLRLIGALQEFSQRDYPIEVFVDAVSTAGNKITIAIQQLRKFEPHVKGL